MGNGTIGMLLTILGVMMNQGEAVTVRQYGKKHGQGGMLFSGIMCLFAMLYFFATDWDGLVFSKGVLLYGLVSSVTYAVGFYTAYLAFKLGSFGLTRLVISYGVIISTFYGIIFLKEPATVITYIALVLILISLFLMNYQKQEASDKKKISAKWLLSLALVVISNSASTIIAKMQHGAYDGAYINEFMIVSLAGAGILLFILGAIFERDSFKPTFKHGLLYGAGAGLFNGVNNLVGIMAFGYLPLSVISPVSSAISIVIGFLISVLLYKEKFSKRQVVSVVMGILAVILMNL